MRRKRLLVVFALALLNVLLPRLVCGRSVGWSCVCVCVLRVLRDREQLTGHLRVLAAFTLLLLINISHNSERGEWEERERERVEREG